MPLFGHGRHDPPPPPRPVNVTVPGLSAAMQADGWHEVPGDPLHQFMDFLVGAVRTMHGSAATAPVTGTNMESGPSYSDTFRGSVQGRTVTIANMHVHMPPRWGAGAVCAVELPASVMPVIVQPRDQRHKVVHWMPEAPTGDAEFDARYRVLGAEGMAIGRALLATSGLPSETAVLAAPVRQFIMSRDDWTFYFCEATLACVAKGAYTSVGDVSRLITEVLTVVAAIPVAVMPQQVDRTVDDLVARLHHMGSPQDAMTFLQGLSPADRERLARSSTPFAAFAHARTPMDMMNILASMDVNQRMQLMAIFSRTSGR